MTFRVGIIGCGNLAGALVRGWADPVVCADRDDARAQALAAEVGGQAVSSNAEVAEAADVIVLCHKPKQLSEVAEELRGTRKPVVSVLGSTPVAAVRAAYPDCPVYRVLPSLCAEVAAGPLVLADGPPQPYDAEVRELFGRLGHLTVLDEELIDVAMGLTSNTPAYYALIVEAQVDAGVRRGLPSHVATELVIGAMGGTAELLRHRQGDTLRVRREVTSPGGSTARGLAALESAGVRAALSAALDAILDDGS